jgi:hypothetical protein
MIKRLALGMVLALTVSAGAPAGCIDVHDNAVTVELRGILTHLTFAGLPNFEDVRRGDTPEPSYILELAKPICAEGDEFVDPAKQVDRVHLYVGEEGKAADRLRDELAHLRGKRVLVTTSSLFGERATSRLTRHLCVRVAR